MTTVLAFAVVMVGCSGSGGGGGADPPGQGLAVLGSGSHSIVDVEITEIGTAADSLNTPRDLAFHPETNDLWVVNYGDSSMVIFTDVGLETQSSTHQAASGHTHFLARPAALAFGAPGRLATAQEEDEITQRTTPPDFMGPTLWTSDAQEFDAGDHGHLDMLHNSPNSVGIAWERDNVYWVFDGAHQSLTRYDFHDDHGLGGTEHGDGEVWRYAEGQVGYVGGVSSHVEIDLEAGLLYAADAGNGRICTLEITAGRPMGTLLPNYDGSNQYRMADAETQTLIDGAAAGLAVPSGLALTDDAIFVTDNATSVIAAFTREGTLIDYLALSAEISEGGLQGITVDVDGNLLVVDSVGNRVLRISAR